MELSLRMGVLANYLDVRPRFSTSDLLVNLEHVDSYAIRQALTRVADNFSILPGPFDTIEPISVELGGVMRMLEMAKYLSAVAVWDVPCTYDDFYFGYLSAADQIVLVVDQSVSSIRGAQMVSETLGGHRPFIVINRYDRTVEGFSAQRLRGLLKPRELWTIPNDPSVAGAANSGRPLRLHDSRSNALADIDQLVDELAPVDTKTTAPQKSLSILGRLTHVFNH